MKWICPNFCVYFCAYSCQSGSVLRRNSSLRESSQIAKICMTLLSNNRPFFSVLWGTRVFILLYEKPCVYLHIFSHFFVVAQFVFELAAKIELATENETFPWISFAALCVYYLKLWRNKTLFMLPVTVLNKPVDYRNNHNTMEMCSGKTILTVGVVPSSQMTHTHLWDLWLKSFLSFN